jgi:hypothetical protein
MQNAQHWGEARVHALRDITPTVREISLQPANGVLPHQPGGHLQIQVLVGLGLSARGRVLPHRCEAFGRWSWVKSRWIRLTVRIDAFVQSETQLGLSLWCRVRKQRKMHC